MKKTLNVLVVVLISFSLAAWGLTKVTGQQIVNSLIDSTPIGTISPAIAHFITTHVSSNLGSSVPSQGAWTEWNIQGRGDTDYVNHHGLGPGSFNWYNTAGSLSNPIMSLDANGNLTASTFNGNFNGNISGNFTGGTATGVTSLFAATGSNGPYQPSFGQGGWITWNQSSGVGETDFTNSRGGGAGGFRWYNTATGAALGNPLMGLDSGGGLTVTTVNSNLNGNANTAGALNHTPAGCGGSAEMIGISANGNAICRSYSQHGQGGGGTVCCNSYASTPITVSFSPGYTNTGYAASCTIVGPTSTTGDAPLAINGITVKSNSSLVVQVSNMAAHSASFAGVDCVLHGVSPAG